MDATWDDTCFDTVSRDYFNLPDDVFALTHTPFSASGKGVDYQYPLPEKEKIEPTYQCTEGVYLDDSVHIAKDAEIQDVFAMLGTVCHEAALQGKSAFGVNATEDEAEHVLACLLEAVQLGDEVTRFFDLYMRDDVELAGLYAGLTGEYVYQDGVLTMNFRLYEEDGAPQILSAYADGVYRGDFVSIAQAYLALAGEQINTLELCLSQADAYYLPERVPAPDAKKIKLTGDYGQTQVYTLRGVTLTADLEMTALWLVQIAPMTLDLNGHTLMLNQRASIGQPNINYGAMDNQDTGRAKLSMVQNGNIICTGSDVKEIYCNVDVATLTLEDVDKLSLRGKDVVVNIKQCTVRNPGVFKPCWICPGENEAADAVTLCMDKLTIEGDALLTISPCSGQQKVRIGDVDNQGTWSLGFHVAKLDSLIGATEEFVLPEITINGRCDPNGQIDFQYDTIKTPEEVGELFASGIVMLNAPQADPLRWRVTISLYGAYDALVDPDSYQFVGGEYHMTKDDAGSLLLGPKYTYD